MRSQYALEGGINTEIDIGNCERALSPRAPVMARV